MEQYAFSHITSHGDDTNFLGGQKTRWVFHSMVVAESFTLRRSRKNF